MIKLKDLVVGQDDKVAEKIVEKFFKILSFFYANSLGSCVFLRYCCVVKQKRQAPQKGEHAT